MKNISCFRKVFLSASSTRRNTATFRSIFWTFALTVFFVFSANAQTTKISVGVTINADDSIKSEIESYIKRELRSLNDIDLYATKPHFEIQLVAVKPNGIVAISVLVIRKRDFTTYINSKLTSKSIEPKIKNDLIENLAINDSVDQHFLFSDSLYNLSELCKSVVAKVDANTFEGERKLNKLLEEADELIRKTNPSSQTTQTKKAVQPTNSLPNQNNQPVFERRYVGGNKPPQITVKNDADVTLTLGFGNVNYIIPAGQTQTIETTQGGNYNFTATAPGVESLSGQKIFEVGYVYTWRFYIVTTRR